ncbi:glycosyltransferase family 2 protein [Halorussus litoreus]|uniref:glycosyltransferase family 2 protein n=1 Tax=Halorussus litoreus TaxID=1710536 RepID=UPI000E248D37|nr:glycosyltransferase family 2 protein [Halorussus litoreus]
MTDDSDSDPDPDFDPNLASDPDVSVIVPTYERADVLPRALDSALGQSFSDLEVVVVDDGSTDGTAEIVAKYRNRDDRVRSLAHEENRGLAAARNTGIEAATGEYVTFLDSDDELHPDLVAETMAVLADRPTDCAGAFVAYEVMREGSRAAVHDAEGLVRSVESFDGRQVRMGGTTLRARALDDLGGFDETFPYGEEYDLWIRLVADHYLVGIDEPLYRYYKHGEQLTANDGKIIEGVARLLAKHPDLPPAYAARHRYARGHAFARQGRMNCAAREFHRAIAADPRRPMNYYYYVAASTCPPLVRVPPKLVEWARAASRALG